ncbi:hypothetical protein ACLOJK_002991 [Asimina triloba]
MSTASATVSPSAAIVTCPGRSPSKAKRRVVYISGMSSFAGLKAHNSIVYIGQPVCANYSFAMYMKSLKAAAAKGRGNGGGALSSSCNAAGEIFKIAAIMNGLVLVGVAVGFLLLRIEAWVEESE